MVALLTAFTLWLPVLPIGILVLKSGWFDGVRVGTPGALTSIIDVVYDPIVDAGGGHPSDVLVIFAGGIGILLAAFAVFDRALPNLEQPSLKVERVKEWLHHPLAMFALGPGDHGDDAVCVDIADASDPAVAQGLRAAGQHHPVRHGREHLDLGGYSRGCAAAGYAAGIHDRVHTDGRGRRGFADVLLFFYKPYSRAILATARRITHTRRGFALFLGAILLVPLVLFLV